VYDLGFGLKNGLGAFGLGIGAWKVELKLKDKEFRV
jgi:hypothetical protein